MDHSIQPSTVAIPEAALVDLRHRLAAARWPRVDFAELQRKARARTDQSFRIVSIQEAGLDGFWIHGILKREGMERVHCMPAASR